MAGRSAGPGSGYALAGLVMGGRADSVVRQHALPFEQFSQLCSQLMSPQLAEQSEQGGVSGGTAGR